ncbi:MAG: GH3 auxin-responsive promoter family protein [Hespellia sp.]|nr:GH3 auxin-responsive promoter family protein [Hespellia sp.]
MRFEDKLKEYTKEEMWQEHCGFLDLTTKEFMEIQYRLMEEQMQLWGASRLGQTILKGKKPQNVDEFRRMVPLTTYEDYAEILLSKEKHFLPADPVLWIQTTWEGGARPIKVAPYTKSMLETYQDNMIGCLMLSTSSGRGDFDVKPKETILYGLAPLPYATGLFPVLLNEEINMEFLPPVKEAEAMSFSERNKKGFKLGMKKGIDYFFGVGSVTYYVSQSLSSMNTSKKRTEKSSDPIGMLRMWIRLMKGKKNAAAKGRLLSPGDMFKLKGFMCAGTDNRCYKDELEELWGIRPMEIFAGTEPTCIGTEIWSRDGLYLFPDACFYEFIPENEMDREQPMTCLFDEVTAGEKYELVITVLKGGAFARYRVGDVYQCIGLENPKDQTKLPRFEYIDRIPDIIDVAGFTRITAKSVERTLQLSGLMVKEWTARKEFNEKNKPFLHMYVEMEPESFMSNAVTIEVLREHLSIYFKYLDSDYKDLKRILGMEPLEITILRIGTFERYHNRYGAIRSVNPKSHDLQMLLKSQEKQDDRERRAYRHG